MNYEQMWNDLKWYIDMAVDEGVQCGYNKEVNVHYGAFYAYNRVLEEINRLEGVRNESN